MYLDSAVCSSVRFAQLLQTCEFLCGTWNGQRVLFDSVQFVLSSLEPSDRWLYPKCACHFFEWIFGQVGSVSLVYQHLVVTCHLLLDSIQRFFEPCSKSWVILVELN